MAFKILLAPQRLSKFSPQGFRSYVKALYQKPEGLPSSVSDIALYFGKRNIVKVKNREPKFVTLKEIKQLSLDYGKTETELTELFKSRKIEVKE